jgi:hypothetical protein
MRAQIVVGQLACGFYPKKQNVDFTKSRTLGTDRDAYGDTCKIEEN